MAHYYAITDDLPSELATRYTAYIRNAPERARAILDDPVPDPNVDSPIDLGGGTGGLLTAAHGYCRAIVGLDIALRWLILARKRLQELGLRAELVCADVEAPPVPEVSFSRAVAADLIEHVYDPARTLGAIRRLPRWAASFGSPLSPLLPRPPPRPPASGAPAGCPWHGVAPCSGGCAASIRCATPTSSRPTGSQAFDVGAMTSNGGGLLLRHTDRAIGLIERVATCFADHRKQDQVVHTLPAHSVRPLFPSAAALGRPRHAHKAPQSSWPPVLRALAPALRAMIRL